MSDRPTLQQQITGHLHLGEVLNRFVLAKAAQGCKPKTLAYYREEVGRFIRFAAAHEVTAVQAVTPELLRQWLASLTGRNLGGRHAAYRPVRAMFRWYAEEYEPEGWKNPMAKLKIPAPRPRALPGVTMEVYRQLVDGCAGPWAQRDRALLYVLLDTCARADELIRLDLRHVNLDTGDVLIESGKGGKARFVAIARTARRELRAYLRSRSELEPDDPLFLNNKGQRITYDGLVSLIRWRSAKAGVDPPGLHDIRRGGALELLRNGADLAYISRYLGHASVAVTMRYLALTPDDTREMLNRFSPVEQLQRKK